MDRQGTGQSCTGMWGPYNLEIVDKVVVPKDLPPGRWVLNWRMDQEESNQIWQSCGEQRGVRVPPPGSAMPHHPPHPVTRSLLPHVAADLTVA